MTHAVGDKVTLPDGRRAIVLDRERVSFHGHALTEYTLRFSLDSVHDEATHAVYIPEAMVINSARLQ
tara:strand:+ start:759 stop:959 length:201 start_codon:yes stop_codon:yes gene_type:complete